MWAVISGIIQIIFLILKTKTEKDSEERKRKDELLDGWTKAIKSGDKSQITSFLDKLNAGGMRS